MSSCAKAWHLSELVCRAGVRGSSRFRFATSTRQGALDGLSGSPPKRFARIIHGREQECSLSAALSLDPEGPRVLFRISSLGPCEPAIVPQEAPILELLRRLAARSDPLRVVQAG